MGILGSQNIRRKVLELKPVSCRACFFDKTCFLDKANSSDFVDSKPRVFTIELAEKQATRLTDCFNIIEREYQSSRSLHL